MTGLADGILPPRTDPALAATGDTTREQQQVPDGGDGLADIFMTVAVRTSAGPGKDHMRLPQAEVNLLVARKHGVPGTQPPRGFLGTPEPSVRAFDDNHRPRGGDDGLRH